MFAVVASRYFLTAGLAYWVLWKTKAELFSQRRIDQSPREPEPALRLRKQIRNEIYYSVLTCAIFALAGAAIFFAWQNGHTKIYLRISDFGWLYFFVSFWIAAFLHETYFYWAHRWMHLPRFFKHVHKIHHDSKSPTPWAASSFHPWEALIEALILPAIVFVIPLHPAVLLANLTLMSVFSVVNHTGYELYSRNFARHRFWRYWVSATHHQAHHRSLRLNYGLYFTFWDHWMKTQQKDYEQSFRASPFRTDH